MAMAAASTHPAQRPDFLKWALAYARSGWPVFPVVPQAKRPLTTHGVKDATTDLEVIESWWRRWPRANIALAIQPPFLVVDFDSEEALHRLKAEDWSFPTTVRGRTARGIHLWYRSPNPVRNRVEILPDVDIRAAGGYVLVAPSVHPSSAVYRWEVRLRRNAIAEAPAWLERLMADAPAHQGRKTADWLKAISEPVPEGRRNQTLAEVSGLLFRNLPAGLAEELAYCWAQIKMSPPLQDGEIHRTLNSIAGRELRRRGGAR